MNLDGISLRLTYYHDCTKKTWGLIGLSNPSSLQIYYTQRGEISLGGVMLQFEVCE